MMRGTFKFDGISLGELSANFIEHPGSITLKAKAAFIDSKTGATHGWTQSNGPWSQETIAKLRELSVLMEQDLAGVHLQNDGATTLNGPTMGPVQVAGLGEHLGSDEPPQV